MKRLVKTNFLGKFIFVCFELLSLLFLTSRITYFLGSISENIIIKGILFLGIAGMFCLTILLWDKIEKFGLLVKDGIKNLSVTKMIFCILILSLITKISLLFILGIDSSLHPDCKMYWSFIQQLTNKGIIVENADYASRYAYTVMFSTFFLPFSKIFGAKSILMMNLYLCIWFSIAAVLLFDTIKYHFGKNYAFVAVMTWVLLPIGMLEPLFLCHENAFVVLQIIAIWIFFKLYPSAKSSINKTLCIIATSIVISYATTINKFGFISICAFSIVLFIDLIANKKSLKAFIKFFAIVLSFAIIYTGFSTVRSEFKDKVVDKSGVEQRTHYAIPFAWPFYVGMNYDSSGQWTAEDYETFYKHEKFETKEESQNYQKEVIKIRIDDYLKHPVKLVKHINDKFELISYAYNPIVYNAGNSVNKFIMTGYGGIIQKAMSGLFAIINIAFSIMIVLSFKLKKKQNVLELYFKLMMLGTCGILVFTEVMAKYSSHLLFINLAIMILGLKDFDFVMKSMSDRIKGKIKKK